MAIRDYDSYIEDAAAKNGLNPDLLRAVMEVESGGNPRASSGKAFGVMQFTPDTARNFGINPLDPVQSIYAGAKYLRQNHDRFGGDTNLALAAYNAGPEAVAKYGGIPPFAETRAYVPKVYGAFQKYASLRTGTATDAQPTMMARQTEATPEVQPVSIQRNIAPITGLTRTEDVVNQVASPQQKQEDEFDPIAFQQRAMADSQGETETSDEFDPIAFQKRAEASMVEQPVQQSLQDAILQGSDVGGQVALTPGDQTNQIAVGMGEGLSRMGGKYGAAVSPALAFGLGGMQGEAPELPSSQASAQQAQGITDYLNQQLGVSDASAPQGVTGKVLRGVGQGVPALAEAALIGKGVGPVARAVAPAASRTMNVIAESSPTLARTLGFAGSGLKDAAVFGAMEAADPRASAGDVAKSAAMGLALGPINKMPLPARAAGGAGLFGGVEALRGGDVEDIAAAAIQGGGYSALAGGSNRPGTSGFNLDKYITDKMWKAVGMKVPGLGRASRIEARQGSGVSVVKEITQQAREGKLELEDAKGRETKLPETALAMADATQQSLFNVLEKTRAIEKAAGKGAEVIPRDRAIKELEAYGNDVTNKDAHPETASAALAEAERLRAMDSNPSEQMDLGKLIKTIKNLNDNKSLKEWSKNVNADTGAKVMVDKIKQKAYNETLYDFVETRTGAEYQDARRLMHDHMAIEKQVADKAVTFMRRAPKGFFDVVDPHLALEFARGLWKLDPAAIVGSGAGWFVKRQWKKMNSPDHNIKQMFKTTDKYLPEREPFDASKLPTQTPEPEQILDLTDRIPTYEETVPTVGAQPSQPVGVPAQATAPPTNREVVSGLPRQIKVVPQTQSKVPIVRPENLNPTPVATPQNAVERYLAEVTSGRAGGGGVPTMEMIRRRLMGR